ncbi:M16 family metallopeptidase [Pedobacter sp. MR22-3]|uniref:M16 family metallopeptidase n=1 Tax=Pedobacter sp. MR22-3 TaxID=2994552 RepID=UPI002247E58E|nr:M16 family metallopeptidase [Pedobacter sp. MR22-3]MCX2584442.1 insulinase family protein [Pedobacter sp. MR22-3]
MNLRKLFSTTFITVLCYTSQAQNLPFDAAVRTGKLPNGFTYYIRHNEEPKNRVVFYLANKVGSVLEDDDQQGLAHFMEHMSFNGTKNFPKNELVDYLQKTGVRFGADLNATTNFDETIYQLPIPSDKPEIVQNGLQIMRDWAQDATLDPAEINKERGVILEEKRIGKGAADRMRSKYFPVMLNNSVYAKRLPIGTEEVLNNFKPETLKRFYHDWYRPNLQALVVVGDVDVDAMEKAIKAKFSDLKNPVNEKPRPAFNIPLSGKDQFIVVTDPEVTATNAEVMIKQPKLELHTAANYREFIVRQLLNKMLGERYADLQRKPNPPYLRAGAGVNGFIANLDNYSVSVTAKPGELETGFKAAWRISEQAKRYGFTTSELERVKLAYLNQTESALKEKNKTRSDSYVKEYVEYFLHGTAAPGIEFEYTLVKDALSKINLDELNAYIKTVIKGTGRDVLIMAPDKEKASLPSEQVFMSWIKAVESENLTAYHEETNNLSLLDKSPVAGKIVKTLHDKKLNITTIFLSNGIKVLLKPTDFRNDQILFNGISAGGTSLYSDADFQSANAANLVPSFGAGNYNNAQLSKYLSGKQFGVRPSIGERQQSISGSSNVKDLEAALQLMYAYFKQPRKDTVLFKNYVSRTKASLANRMNDPASVFNDTVSAVLSNHNLRRASPTIATLDKINLERAFTIYKERFADASGFTFVFTGSIDTTAIKPLLEKYVASLPALNKKEKAKDLHINIPAGLITKTVHKGTEAKANVMLVFSGLFDYSFANDLKLDALKETIEIRLIERLREEEGGVYSPSIRAQTSKLPQGRFNLTISFGCAPMNVEKLITSTLDEVNKIKSNGPLQVNLDKFKAETQRSIELQLKSNNFWQNYLLGQVQNNEPLDAVNEYSKDVSSMTTEDIKSMANKYLNGKNFIRLVLLPEKSN